jgi:hypothetical protein
MPFNVTEFASAGLPFGGARPSLFSVTVDTPAGVPAIGERMSFTCRAAQIPASILSVIPQRYFGREVKMAGTRTFEPWTVTVLNDEDFVIRQAMEQWSNAINAHQANLRDGGLSTLASYRTTATVSQYNKTGGVVRTYEFINIFPTNVSAIDLDWDNADAIEIFTVEFQYDYWQTVAPTTTGTIVV